MSKSNRITIRLTEEMRKKIDAESKKDATDVASFIRERIAEYFSQTYPQSLPSQ